MSELVSDLVALARTLGDPAQDLAILAEGNVSGAVNDDVFFVKASGFSMRTIGPEGFVEMNAGPILAAFDGPDLSDAQVKELLASSRVHPEATILPSVETFMHAYLLRLPGVRYIGHTHPTPLIALLSTAHSERMAAERFFPDEIVCCGPESCWVPYVDPGLPLARAIRDAVVAYMDRLQETPRTIWLESHGLIALGRTLREVESASFMSAKAARGRLAALATGLPLRTLSPAEIARIHTRPDEHYRQKLI